jgi:YHS domain-containing protein
MKIILIPLAVIALASVSCNKQEGTNAASKSESRAKSYPLETCLVSGEKLGAMGDPIVINHEGQEIKFCCDSCVPKFKKDPAKYLHKLDRANPSQ